MRLLNSEAFATRAEPTNYPSESLAWRWEGRGRPVEPATQSGSSSPSVNKYVTRLGWISRRDKKRQVSGPSWVPGKD